MPEPEQQDMEFRYAGFWVRSWAVSIDTLIIILFTAFLIFLSGFFIDVQDIAMKFSIYVMDFLAQKMQQIALWQGMQVNPNMMQTTDLESSIAAVRHSKIGLDIYILIADAIFSIFYYAIPESSRMQGSIGKYVMKIKIVNENGGRISFPKALERNAIKILAIHMSIITSLLVYITIPFHKKKRGVYDMICKTYVIYK